MEFFWNIVKCLQMTKHFQKHIKLLCFIVTTKSLISKIILINLAASETQNVCLFLSVNGKNKYPKFQKLWSVFYDEKQER